MKNQVSLECEPREKAVWAQTKQGWGFRMPLSLKLCWQCQSLSTSHILSKKLDDSVCHTTENLNSAVHFKLIRPSS